MCRKVTPGYDPVPYLVTASFNGRELTYVVPADDCMDAAQMVDQIIENVYAVCTDVRIVGVRTIDPAELDTLAGGGSRKITAEKRDRTGRRKVRNRVGSI